MAHLWACMPFLIAWITVPSAHEKIPPESFGKIESFLVLVIAYLLARTVVAFRDPPKLAWEYVFPPIDVAVVSVLIYLGNRDPLSNIALLYFFPLAQAAGTLNVRWASAVALMVIAGVALATHGLHSEEPFNAVFRYYFIFVLASLVTLLARASASLREQLGVARDRNRMAMEMHDGVQGHLMAVSKQMELVEKLAPSNPDRAAAVAAESRETARLAADELRYLVQRMRAPSLAEGFVPALQQFSHNQASRHGLEHRFDVLGDPSPLSQEAEHALFRIAQEALNNVLRHSQATRVDFELDYREVSNVSLSVRDNGIGFQPDWASPGLAGMRQRAAEVGGTLGIESSPSGVTLTASVPR